ncbi:arrestin domain-containing protein 17-like [Limulus polyphemus]|uniref:Arrestin domain-containing protein 17-like n=1 Tax=Limulus polyphemus TaxID=6850 RepID=A0ABM1BST2_LIMPO|nr:arrestin domain-containing protein 17-like [Limulus polyphemus]
MTKKLRKFLILLDNESLLYFPGSFLSGRVLVELDDHTQVSGLFFHILGEGVVQLSKRGRSDFSDKENYIDFRMRLLGEGQPKSGNNREIVLPPGVQSFPFKLGLPLGLPSTFLGKHGWVQYYCKVALKESSGVVHKNQQVFIVMNPIDLNLEPSLLMQPFHCEIEDTLGLSCFSSGPVTCRVRLDRGGYVPGESISIFANIENNSKVTIRKTKAVLTETIQYTAKNKLVQAETRELASLQKGEISADSTDQWKNELLYIPPLPPTNLRGCHLIRVQYDVYFLIYPKGPEKEIKLQLPIMMATYPIRNTDGTLQRKKGTHYPTVLPVFRPWLSTNTLK